MNSFLSCSFPAQAPIGFAAHTPPPDAVPVARFQQVSKCFVTAAAQQSPSFIAPPTNQHHQQPPPYPHYPNVVVNPALVIPPQPPLPVLDGEPQPGHRDYRVKKSTFLRAWFINQYGEEEAKRMFGSEY